MLRHVVALSLLTIGLTGCANLNPVTRAQMAEEHEKVQDVRSVRVVADVAEIPPNGITAQQIHGVGLVTGLAGTGHAPAGYFRDLLEQYLLKHNGPKDGAISSENQRTSVRQILANPNNAVVIVTGFLSAGVRKGDRFDLEITLPPGSKCSSLAGGVLQPCVLRIYEKESDLSEKSTSNRPLGSHVLAFAKGPLIVGFGKNIDAGELRTARVWQGGTSRVDRAYPFILRGDKNTMRVTNGLAQRINAMYQDDPNSLAMLTEQQRRNQVLGAMENQLNIRFAPPGMEQGDLAKPVTQNIINARVPFAYRFNHARFLYVGFKTPVLPNDPGLEKYKARLAKMLHDPRDTMPAAIRLESMGRDSIEILKTGLTKEHPFVRYASAEALAYLGSTAGVEELTRLAQAYPLFAAPATLALASLGESVCKHTLAEMLGSSQPALRCAAFHALTLLDETDANLGTLPVRDVCALHCLPQAPNATVYFSTAKRAQVILFGRNIVLSPKTMMIVGDFTVKMDAKTNECVVKRITLEGERCITCSSHVRDVLLALADLNAAYPDIVGFLQRASECEFVNCPVANWSVQGESIEVLAEAGRKLQ